MTRTISMKRIVLVLIMTVAVTFLLGSTLMLQNAEAKGKKKTVYVVTKMTEKYDVGTPHSYKISYKKSGLANAVECSNRLYGEAFSYNKKGKLKRIKENFLAFVRHLQYKKGHMIKMKMYCGEWGYFTKWYIKIKTDSKGRITRADRIDPTEKSDPESNYSYEYKYDKKNRIKKITKIDLKGKRISYSVKYDKKGNMIKGYDFYNRKVENVKNYYKNGMNRPYKSIYKGEDTRKYEFKYKKIKVSKKNLSLVLEQQRFSPIGINTPFSLFLHGDL